MTAPANALEQEISYRDKMVKDTIICSLKEPEIQQDVLSQENQDMALEDVIKLIEAKESGKRSQASLLSPENAAAWSMYRKDKLTTVQPEDKKPCSYCGGKSQCDPRPKVCLAFGKTCTKCNRNDHFAKVCRSKTKKNTLGDKKGKGKDSTGKKTSTGKGSGGEDSDEESNEIFFTHSVVLQSGLCLSILMTGLPIERRNGQSAATRPMLIQIR